MRPMESSSKEEGSILSGKGSFILEGPSQIFPLKEGSSSSKETSLFQAAHSNSSTAPLPSLAKNMKCRPSILQESWRSKTFPLPQDSKGLSITRSSRSNRHLLFL